MVSLTEFRETFLHNVNSRSRTAKGVVDNSVSSVKLPLLMSGEEMNNQLRSNLEVTVESMYENLGKVRHLDIELLTRLFEQWFDSLQSGLLDMEGYEKKRLELGLTQENLRYRIWNVSYDPMSPVPERIHPMMHRFTSELVWKVKYTLDTPNVIRTADLLAYADRNLDRVIHPWLDGCGRFATAIVVWLAAGTGGYLPRFASRDMHYKAMEDEGSHIRYFSHLLRP